MTQNTNNSVRPVIGVWENYVHVFWCEQIPGPGSEYDIFYRRSIDRGKSWEDTKKLIDTDKTLSGLSVALNKSTIHLVWSDGRSGFNYIYYTKSNDSGENWEIEKIVSSPSSGGYDPDIAVNGNYIHVVYWHNYKLFYMNSSDNGNNWSEVQQLTSPIRDSNHPAIAINDNNVHIVWMDHYDKFGNPTMGAIFYMNSTDGGETWSEDINLTPLIVDSDYPDIVVNGSTIHVSYVSDRNGFLEIYYERSEDNGITWTDDLKLSNLETDFGADSKIAHHNNSLHLVWWAEKGSERESYYLYSPNSGYNWSNISMVSPDPIDSLSPDIGLYNNNVHLVWRNDIDGIPEIYYKRNNVFADLLITPNNITFSDNIPNIGMPTKINATIQNIGEENVSATIEFYDGDPNDGGVFINSTDILVNISESVNATINWIPPTNGTHNVYVKITNVSSLETNFSNNIAYKSVMVNGEPELTNIPSTYTLDEDSMENQLINLSEYAKDDLDSWDELSFDIVGYSNSSIVSVSIFDGHFLSVDTLTGPANDNWTGTIEIVIEVADTLGLTNVSDQFTVTVTEVNDAPIVINPIPNFSIEEDTSDSTTVNLTNVFFGSDNSSLYYTCSGNTNISVIINENGFVTFTPLENWTGEETMTFYATDNLTSPVSNSATITVTPVNDAPVVIGSILDFNMDEDTLDDSTVNLADVFYDVDNTTLYFSHSGSNDISIIINESGSVTFIPVENRSGTETITFHATDNLTISISEDVTITVIPINDPPIITILFPLNNSNHFTSDTIYFNITVLDVDNDTFTYFWDFGDGTTSTLINATHQFSEAGIYNVSITVSDGSANDTRIVTVVVEPAIVDRGENGHNISLYIWILIIIIIAVILLLFLILRRFKKGKTRKLV